MLRAKHIGLRLIPNDLKGGHGLREEEVKVGQLLCGSWRDFYGKFGSSWTACQYRHSSFTFDAEVEISFLAMIHECLYAELPSLHSPVRTL